jgi:ketosteroid isomerase-like protein
MSHREWVIGVVGLVVGCASAVGLAQTIHGRSADEQSIRDLIALHASASQQDDLAGLVAGLHADADSRLANGRILSGRAEIEKSYRDVLSGGPRRMAHVHPPDSVRIRFLQPDVAFVDVDSTSPSGAGSRTPFFLIFTKVQGKWGVAVERRGVPLN